MHLFAIETDVQKLKAQFLNPTEKEVLTVPKHVCHFIFALLLYVSVFSLAAVVLAAAAAYQMVPMPFLIAATVVIVFVFWALVLNAYIDWRYDFILFTTDKMVVVESSLLNQTVSPINFEHVSSLTARTQYWNLFSFGILDFQLRDEPTRANFTIDYIPEAAIITAKVTDILTDFQRRKMHMGSSILPEGKRIQQQMEVEKIERAKVAEEKVEQNHGKDTAEGGQGNAAAQQDDARKKREADDEEVAALRRRMLFR